MIYTDGYMAHDPGYVRFYAYLSLFSSSMLGLVISPNLVQIYIFWELVGMCSYLLIGFWYDRQAAADACQKAFITNRVGDFGLLLGILALYWATGSFEFAEIGENLETLIDTGALSSGMGVLFAVLVFLGPVAQICPIPPPCLASRCHGRTDPHLGPHPCCHHGRRRGVPHCPDVPRL